MVRVMHLIAERISRVWNMRMVFEVVTIRNIWVFEIILTGVGNHFGRGILSQ
jgi:hypothetical protein